SALASAWTIWEQKFHARAIGPEWAQAWPERLIIAGRALWFYLGKLIWPEPLIFIYPRWQIHSAQVIEYLPLLAATATLILLWFLRGKARRATFFAAAYYVISLFPVLGFFDVFFFRHSLAVVRSPADSELSPDLFRHDREERFPDYNGPSSSRYSWRECLYTKLSDRGKRQFVAMLELRAKAIVRRKIPVAEARQLDETT